MTRLLIFTDLDGTLLRHDNYAWSEASPALQTLQQLDCPVIFNSSKTCAELLALSNSMQNPHPFVMENGGAIGIPDGYFENWPTRQHDYSVVYFAKPYQEITTQLSMLRHSHGFCFSGFTDMTTTEIAQLTGMDKQQTLAAQQRQVSEPLLWHDSDSALQEFKQLLQQHDLTLTKGGRFYHVMSKVNKGDAVTWLINQYQKREPAVKWLSVGLGDSFNDIEMLNRVDYPVLINNPHISQPDLSELENLITPLQPGPAGWNQAILELTDSVM